MKFPSVNNCNFSVDNSYVATGWTFSLLFLLCSLYENPFIYPLVFLKTKIEFIEKSICYLFSRFGTLIAYIQMEIHSKP